MQSDNRLSRGPFALDSAVTQAVIPFCARRAAGSGQLNSRQTAANARQMQSAQARHLASILLRRLGADSVVVLTNDDGSPRWPPGFIGSITHTDSVIGVAIASTDSGCMLGIDIEPIVDASAASDINKYCVSDRERRLAAMRRCDDLVFATVAFSAKESLFKAIYPRARRFFDFTDAEIVDLNCAEGRVLFELLTSVGPGYQKGSVVAGNYALQNASAYTSVYIPAVGR